MKKILALIVLSLIVHTAWSQSGEGYNPENPADPDVYYTLMLEASPRTGGTLDSNNRKQLAAGQSTYVSATPRLGYMFKRWMMGDSVISTEKSFYFTMPENDVVLTAYFEWNPDYNPQNPGDPDAEGYSHHVYAYAMPSAGGYFNSSSFTLVEGKSTSIYAYPREGYRFESWMCNGEVVSTSNPLNIKMGTSDIAYTATFVYNPVSPGEPSPNVFNSATGEVIIDNFTPGSLNSAIYTVVGSSENYNAVHSILVIGRMQSSDFGFARSYSNCSQIDLSRTTGYTEVPSWSFEGAGALTKIFLPASVERIGSNAFDGCKNLSELYCYATTPPEVNSNSFFNVAEALVVKVPASAVPLYQKATGWKDLTILPVDAETCNMAINLPMNASDGRYKNMFIELENAISGQIYKYLITDHQSYIFSNLIRNTSYNIYVKNSLGAILGSKEKVLLGEEDLTITFESLRQPQTISVKIFTTDEIDVTSQTTITWLNEDGSLLANGSKITGILEDSKITYRIQLPQALAIQYKIPADASYTVKSSGNDISCHLQSFEEISLSGRIIDITTEKTITNAAVTISQLLNGKYTKSFTTRTDNEGKYAFKVFNEQSNIIVSANNYLSQTLEFENFNNHQQLDDIALKSITGAVIEVNYTFKESVENGQDAEVINWYSDEANVVYSLYNKTQGKDITAFNVQTGNIVLLEEVSEGDLLDITAKSKTNMFRDVTATTMIDSRNRAEITIPIVELGALKAYYTQNENNGVVGILYDSKGILLRKSTFNGDTLNIKDLTDGSYTLVTMGNSTFFNSVLNLSELTNTGLEEGRDFVKKTVSISSGIITKLNIGSVPTFDDSKLYYTGESTSFSANKSQVTIGNYITLRAKIDFKDQYATSVNNLKLIVDLPESCTFVDSSVLTGNGMGGYEVAGNRVTVNLNKQDELIRFCVIPIAGGTCKPNAFVQFNYNGKTILQPIGSAYFNAQNFALTVPDMTADSIVVVNGTALSDCVVKVYDGDVMIGQTRSFANGRWSARVNLYKPYSHSFHNIYAEVEAENGQTLLTDTKLVEYDKTMTQLKTITMLYNGNAIVFDQIEGTTSTNTYSYAPSVADFTFIAQFTKNDTSIIKNLEFKVLASDGTVRRIPSTFSSIHNAWVGQAIYGISSRIPVNVSAEYTINGGINNMEMFLDQINTLTNCAEKMSAFIEEKATIELSDDQNNYIELNYNFSDYNFNYKQRIESLDYDKALQLMNTMQFDFVNGEDGLICTRTDTYMDSIVVTYIDETDAFKIIVYTSNLSQNTKKLAPGDGLRIFSDCMGHILDIAGILPYLRVRSDIDNMWSLYSANAALFSKQRETIDNALYARCPDGRMRLTDFAIDIFKYEKTQWRQEENRYFEQLEAYIDKYSATVRAKLAYDIALTAIGGRAVSAITKSAKFAVRSKFIAKAAKFFTQGTSKSNVSEIVQNTLGIALNGIINGLDAIVNPKFADFESVYENAMSWGANRGKQISSGYVSIVQEIGRRYQQCSKEPEDDDKDKKDDFNTKNLSPGIDPSGYVYEGVSSNRIQGVTATAFYMETTEDMYGVLHEEPRVWNAEEYAQENPLFTDENGMYQWDVPQGMWQVKFEKEGYETTYSEWLPVPPPQLEVNIGMVQSRQPEVKKAHAYKDGVEVEFDKYMQPQLLNTENILVSQNGVYVEGEVKLLNEETAYNDENVKYVSKIRFVPKTPFTAKEVTLTVANRVKSYADLQMQDSYQQTFDIETEIKNIILDETVKVSSGSTKEVIVQIQPADAANGKTLHAVSSMELITSLDKSDVVIDDNGTAKFSITGELPGTAAITYTIEGYDIEAQQTVNVEMEKDESRVVAVPQTSISSGSAVYRGTTITLSTTEPNSKIYYTLDGSCPCDNVSRILYESPISINFDITIKAMTIAEDESESDVATFVYSILQSNDGVELNNGWNWVSFNMKNDALSDVNSAMTSGSWTVEDEIKDSKYSDSYSAKQSKWIGTLSKHSKLNNTGMFKVHSSKSQTLQLTGEAVNPKDAIITVNPKWNFIGYLPMKDMSVTDALAGYDAKDGDVIKSQDAFATYSSNNGWKGDLSTMNVGKGYMLKRSANASQTTFTYPLTTGKTNAAKALKSISHAYANNMNVIGHVVGIDTQEDDSLVALVGGEVRGASVIGKDGEVFLTVQGDKTAEVELVLKRNGEVIAVANKSLRYESNDILGTLDLPTEIVFADTDENDDDILVSPRVVENTFTVEVNNENNNSVVIYVHNANGLLINEGNFNNDSNRKLKKSFDISAMPSGVYFVTVKRNDASNIVRIIKK